MAVLRMTKMKFYGHHGVSEEEKAKGGNYEVDCEIETDISSCASSDDIDDAVNYKDIYEIAREHVEKRRYNLMETLAANITDAITDRYGSLRLILRVRKMAPPVGGQMEYFEVEVS